MSPAPGGKTASGFGSREHQRCRPASAYSIPVLSRSLEPGFFAGVAKKITCPDLRRKLPVRKHAVSPQNLLAAAAVLVPLRRKEFQAGRAMDGKRI
jgi:hypothetical protein